MNIYGIPGTQVVQGAWNNPQLVVLQISTSIRQSPARAVEFLHDLHGCGAKVVFQGEGFVVVELIPVPGIAVAIESLG